MPSPGARRHLLVFLSYVLIGTAFYWPLPSQMSSVLPGPAGGDTGVYVWNLWVFRHELVEHHRFPFFTLEILSITPAAPLVLHNYTTFANVLAFFVLPLFGVVATYNGLMVFSAAFAAYALYLLARVRSGDDSAAWVAGIAFGFSPFLMARMGAHFSLVQAAPLPIFALLLLKLYQGASWRVAAAAGGVVAWAYLCDPYYAVYCVLMMLFMIGYAVVSVRVPAQRPLWTTWTWPFDIVIVCLAGLIAGILVKGGGRIDMFGLRISMRSLYTPVLTLTVLIAIRLLIALRPRLGWNMPRILRDWRAYIAAALAGAAVLSPVLYAMSRSLAEAGTLNAPVLWRSSARGLDLAALVTPNPLHPLFGHVSASWLSMMPEGLIENVASIPWTLLAVMGAAVFVYRIAVPRGWVIWTLCFLLMALGPFIHVAGVNTYIPTPWTLLRYVPVIGAARMPTRFGVLVAMGMAMVFCLLLADLRKRVRRPALVTGAIAALLVFELMPAPRAVYSAEVPQVMRTIAADPRPLRVLNLPFGIRDGLTSTGNFTALYQYHQTVHEKPLVGGYLSRLPRGDRAQYRRSATLNALIKLSEGLPLTAEERRLAFERAPAAAQRMGIGWVIIDRHRTSADLQSFAIDAFNLRLVEPGGRFDLYALQ